MSNSVTVLGTQAINFTGMNNVKSFTPAEDGQYAVSSRSTVTYHYGNAPLRQVLLFNTAPLITQNSYAWYSVIGDNAGTILQGKKGQPIYVFLVDQMDSSDNTGQTDVTFTKIP